MKALEFQKKDAFKSPPKEWIDHRLEKFYETLNKNTKASALALKELLGTIEMEPVASDQIVENSNIIEQKPYYIAHSNVETLALLDKENKGTNWLQWRKRRDSNPRSLAGLLFSRQTQSATLPLFHKKKMITLILKKIQDN